jgi:hypothetical protein
VTRRPETGFSGVFQARRLHISNVTTRDPATLPAHFWKSQKLKSYSQMYIRATPKLLELQTFLVEKRVKLNWKQPFVILTAEENSRMPSHLSKNKLLFIFGVTGLFTDSNPGAKEVEGWRKIESE